MSCRVVAGLVVACTLTISPARGGSPEVLKERVEAILRTPGYQDGHWGLLVVDRASGDVVFERNADQLFRPASTTKLFSSAAALAALGADFRFQTRVKRTREVGKDGTLPGDLILVASGDFSLGGRTGPDGELLYTEIDHSYAAINPGATLVSQDSLAPLAGLDSLAREIATAGIKSVEDVVVDDRLFEQAESTGSGPTRVSPIVINDNLIDVVVTPAEAPGEPAAVQLVPSTAHVAVDAQVETAPAGTVPVVDVFVVEPRQFQVRGRIPVGHRPVVKIYEVTEPADFARALFIETLRRRGVQVVASPLGRNPSERLPSPAEVGALPKVAEYTSPPFSEYLKVILKVSQNLHASALPMMLAVQSGGRSLHAGMLRQGELLQELGVDIQPISFGGGAGGSHTDLVSPRATVALLRAMAARPDFAVYQAALPVLGRDGTLTSAVAEDSAARGHVRAKTGTYWVVDGLTGKVTLTSKALAGYLETASGRQLVFAFFVNGVSLDVTPQEVTGATAAAGQLLGRLCEVFYDDKGEAPPPKTPEEPRKPDMPASDDHRSETDAEPTRR